MNKTPYFHKPIHTASARKREIERVLRLIRVVKSVRELKRETVKELFFFFLLLGPYEWLSLRFHILKSQFFFFFNGIFWNMPQNIAYSIFLFTEETTHRMGSALVNTKFLKEDLQLQLRRGYRLSNLQLHYKRGYRLM